MTNTMVVDHETEAQLAADAGHQIGCMEEWMETALEAGADAVEIYALWIEQTGNGFKGRKYGACTCTIDEAGGMLITDAIKALEKLGYKVTK
jgi:hypothetical protein